jgi:hypothetical protein
VTIESLIEATQTILRLLQHYSNPPDREMLLDAMLYAHLEGKFGKMSRQFRARLPGRPGARIDFRRGTVAPTLVEFAVRPPKGGGQLYGSQNRSELCKLTRIPQSRARRRYLLLVDLSQYEMSKSNLRATYEKVSSGPGNFKRHPVRVVYVSRSNAYHFKWKR